MIKVNVFGWGLLLRVTILLGACFLSGLIFLDSEWIFSQLILYTTIILVTLEMYNFLQRTNGDLSRWLEALKYEDYGNSFEEKNSRSRYSQLLSEMEKIKTQHAQHSNSYHQAKALNDLILDSIVTGLVLFNHQGDVVLKNSAAFELLKISKLEKMEDLDLVGQAISQSIVQATNSSNFLINQQTFREYLGNEIHVHVRKFKHVDSPFTLIVLGNVGNTGSGNNFETWVNFGKVISHEILNGISPIISLTSTLQDQLNKIEENEKVKTSMQKALDIVLERSQSLQTYSERYRTLQRLPEPKLENIIWSDEIERVLVLYNEELQKNNVEVVVEGDSLNENFKGDSWQMDQVFSNLLLNSIHAFEEKPIADKQIRIEVNSQNRNFVLKFIDNGVGIPEDSRANVFMPFYTTRESGSGIGLSVIKQILWKHNAEIFLKNRTDGTTFVIKFPKI